MLPDTPQPLMRTDCAGPIPVQEGIISEGHRDGPRIVRQRIDEVLLLGGLDTPTAGEVHIGGKRIDSLSEARRAVMRRRQVGIVFQAYNLIGNLTAADNVKLPALIAGFTPRSAKKRREELLEQLEVADKARDVSVPRA